MVLVDLPGDDVILCQITSQQNKDRYAITISASDFSTGSLPIISNIRPTRIFTADRNIIIRSTGILKPVILAKISKILIGLFS
jgi:mRNA interferase MazF